MKRNLYEVFKHPAPVGGLKWAVQFPKGIVCCKTQTSARQLAHAFKPVIDVCIVGNPAIDGKCGDPECLCA